MAGGLLAWVEAFGEHGITVAFDHVRRLVGMGGDKLMPEVSASASLTRLHEATAERAEAAETNKKKISAFSADSAACLDEARRAKSG